MDALLFVLGLALIANTVYGFVLWIHSTPLTGARKTGNIVVAAWVAIVMLPLAAVAAAVYVPWYHLSHRTPARRMPDGLFADD